MINKKLYQYFCLFIMISAALAGCYTRLDRSAPRSPRSMPPPGRPIEEPVMIEPPDSLVQVSLIVSFHSVCRSDPIKVRVSVTNLYDRPVRLGNGSCPVFFRVRGDQGEYKAYIWGLARRLDPNARPYFLDPGESCNREWPWEALVRSEGRRSYRLLKPGDYVLIGTAAHYRSFPVPVRVVDE